MSLSHRPIPPLPSCPRPPAIAKDLHRSYPTGRTEVSRAFCGSAFEVMISAREGFPAGVRARLVTTLNAGGEGKLNEAPFTLSGDGRTLTCRITPGRMGLFSFWAQFSADDGATWVDDRVPEAWVLVDPAQVDQLRMYTLIPNVSGTFSDWAVELFRIKELGFNAVHFLPLTTLDTSLSPYSARDLFGVDPSYVDGASKLGALEQLETVVSTAREIGIRLCFDLVLNHVGVNSEIARRAPDWIMPDEDSPDGLRRARYLSEHGWQPWNDLVLINYEHPSKRVRAEVWNYMQEYALFWGKYASETNGFVRFDNLHSSNKQFIDEVTRRLRETYPNLGIIAEYFTDAGTLLETVPAWGLNLVLATPWDSKWVKQLRDYLRWVYSMADHVRFFMPITSHDSGTPAQEFGSDASTPPRYVAAALLGTGATGITQGVEWGQKEKINFVGRQPRLPRVEHPKHAALIRKVNAILAAEPAFRRGDNFEFVDDGHDAVIAVFRRDPQKVGFLVICNFDILGEQKLEVDLSPFLGEGAVRCVDLMTGEEAAFDGPRMKFEMKACGVKVLRF